MALHGHLESNLQDTLYLRTRIDIGVEGLVIVLIFLTKIHATRKLTDNDKVGTAQQLFLQRRLMQQTVEGDHGAHVGKESQLLAHSQQARLRTHLQRGVVVILQIAYSSEEHGIGTHADIVRGSGIGIATGLDGTGTHQRLLVFKLMATLLGDSIHHSHTLFHVFRTNTVARQDGNS